MARGLFDEIQDFLSNGALTKQEQALANSGQGYTADTIKGNAFDPYAAGDPRLRNDQLGVLDALKNKISQGGLDAVDQQKLGEIQDQNARQVQAQQASIAQEQAQRGMAGGGQQLAQQMLAQQQGANRAADAGMNVAAQAQNARMAALGQLAQTAGNLNQQDWMRQSAQAQAQNNINQFNQAATNQARSYSTAAQNRMNENQAAFQGQRNQANTNFWGDVAQTGLQAFSPTGALSGVGKAIDRAVQGPIQQFPTGQGAEPAPASYRMKKGYEWDGPL